MNIDDDIQALVIGVVNDFFNSVQPCGINRIIGSTPYFIQIRYGDPDGFESCCLYLLNESQCYRSRTPCSLTRCTVDTAFKLVSQIPARTN
jgi:hypothetical protein